MEQCSNCREELQPNFDFCHHCGAAASQHTVAKPAQSNLVELVGDLELIANRSVAAGSTANQTINDWLGSPVSVQRRIFYALLTGLAVVLAAGLTPLTGPFKWLEGWLFLSLLALPWISYWLTGFIPFSNILNTILGDMLSLRRRLLVTFLWTTIFSTVFLTISLVESGVSGENGLRAIIEACAVYAGFFLIVYYFMGQATAWIPVNYLEGSLFLDRMAKDANDVSTSVRDKMHERKICNLQISEIEMARLRRYTAGESSGRQGHQISFTRGRAQVIIFVQDFGHSLFIRWGGYFDASGRRIWVLIGLMLRSFSDFLLRWTGTNFPTFWREYMNVLRPSARSSINLSAMNRGGMLSRLFGMVEGVSEYGWNELYALEASVKDTIVNVTREAYEVHQEADVILAQVERHRRFESQNSGQAGPQ